MTRMLSAALMAGFLSTPAWAGGYTEGPDLSNDRLAPTPVPVSPGSNVVRASMGYTGTVLDRDYFTLIVPEGLQLSALVLSPATQPGGFASFVGMQAGSTLTADPVDPGAGPQLLGWHLYSSADVGTNILDDMGAGGQKIGFSGPLPAGPYTFWVQELSPSFPGEPFPPFPYEFDFQLQAVPEPASLVLMLVGALGVAGLARRRDGS